MENVKVGIVGYGADIPRYRIKAEEIAKVWGADAASYKRGLMLEEKSVPSADQDTATMSVEAARRALQRAPVDPRDIGAIYVGSESHPYAVKPTGTILAEALGAVPHCHTADLEFACKAGSEGMFIASQLVRSGACRYAMGVGADTSQGAPSDALEYSAAAGAAAFIFGREPHDGRGDSLRHGPSGTGHSRAPALVAELLETHAYMTDTPDFWRREHMFYPKHGGRFTGEEAYFRHVVSCTNEIMEKAGLQPKDFRYVVFHQPNGKFPYRAGKITGFAPSQIETGCLVPKLGNTYSGASPLGLTAVLDAARPGDLILMVSYGSGAGSDGFVFKATAALPQAQGKAKKTWDMLLSPRRKYLEYGSYAKLRGKIRMNEEN